MLIWLPIIVLFFTSPPLFCWQRKFFFVNLGPTLKTWVSPILLNILMLSLIFVNYFDFVPDFYVTLAKLYSQLAKITIPLSTPFISYLPTYWMNELTNKWGPLTTNTPVNMSTNLIQLNIVENPYHRSWMIDARLLGHFSVYKLKNGSLK